MSDMTQRHAMPPPADHERHDPMLVAQLVAGDQLAPERQAEAQRLVTSCGACAALAADLRVVSAAVAQEPIPPRRRDFRLSPEQAEALSGNAVTRFLRRFSLPSARAFQPAAAGILSIGLLFVVAGYAWPGGGTITVQAEPNFASYAPVTTGAAPTDGPAEAPPVGAGLDAAAETDVAADALPDDEFFRSLPESQAGDLDRASQKSIASEAEQTEAEALEMMSQEPDAPKAAAPSPADGGLPARAADAVSDPDAALGSTADAVAGEAAEEAVDDAEYRAEALDVTVEEPSAEQEPGAVVPEPSPVAVDGGEGLAANEVVATASEDDGAEDLLIVLGSVLAITGGALLLLSWLARRARDPLAP